MIVLNTNMEMLTFSSKRSFKLQLLNKKYQFLNNRRKKKSVQQEKNLY